MAHAGAEYAARYSLESDVPCITYANGDITQSTISSDGRGNVRPIWALLYNHYVVRKGLKAQGITAFQRKWAPRVVETMAPIAADSINWDTAP